MIHEKLSELDMDFVVLKSKIMLEKLKAKSVSDANLESLVKLAEMGHLDAVCEFYTHFAAGINAIVDGAVEKFEGVSALEILAKSNYEFAKIDSAEWKRKIEKLDEIFLKMKNHPAGFDQANFDEYYDYLDENIDCHPFAETYRNAAHLANDVAFDTDNVFYEEEFYDICDRMFQVLPYSSLFDYWEDYEQVFECRKELGVDLYALYKENPNNVSIAFVTAISLLPFNVKDNDFYRAAAIKILENISVLPFSKTLQNYQIRGQKLQGTLE